jgi:hypothetical protein
MFVPLRDMSRWPGRLLWRHRARHLIKALKHFSELKTAFRADRPIL